MIFFCKVLHSVLSLMKDCTRCKHLEHMCISWHKTCCNSSRKMSVGLHVAVRLQFLYLGIFMLDVNQVRGKHSRSNLERDDQDGKGK